nr:phospholipase-like protein [Tanacetum cinerariifolium]
MSISNTHQQSLADAGSETRPPMLERGSYIPWAIRFRRHLNQKRENKKCLNKEIDEGPYEFKEFTPSKTEPPRMQKEVDLKEGKSPKRSECKGGKEKKNFLTKHIMWLVDDLDVWNAFPWGEYMWEKFYNRTGNVVSRHTEHHLAQLNNNPNFNAIYNLYGFAWAFKMSNPNVPLIASLEEMSHAWFKNSAEFIKSLDAQDDTFLQDEQCREKSMEQHNGMCGDTEDGTFVHRVVVKICPKMNQMPIDDGDGVLDSQSDDGDGVLDSQTKDVIEEASMLPTMSSNSSQTGNTAISEFFALKKEVLLIKQHKDDEFDELTKIFSKEAKLFFSHNDSLNHIGGVSSEAKASSSSAHRGNEEDMSYLADNMETDGPNAKDLYSNYQHHLHLLIKGLGTKIENPSIDSVLVVPPKVDDSMLRTIKPKDDFDEAEVGSYDDDYMSMFNDEEQPAKSSLNDLELQQEPDIVDIGIRAKVIENQARSWSILSEDPYEETAQQLVEQASRSPKYDEAHIEAYIPEVASAPTPPLTSSFLSSHIRPPYTRATMAQMRATVPSTYHSLLPSETPPFLPIPIPVPSTSRRAEILEANTPPRKRLLLTDPRPGCEVGEC